MKEFLLPPPEGEEGTIRRAWDVIWNFAGQMFINSQKRLDSEGFGHKRERCGCSSCKRGAVEDANYWHRFNTPEGHPQPITYETNGKTVWQNFRHVDLLKPFWWLLAEEDDFDPWLEDKE